MKIVGWLVIRKESEWKKKESKNINEIVHMRFYEILRLSVFFPSCDLRGIFYRMYGYSTNSNLSQYPRKGEKIF